MFEMLSAVVIDERGQRPIPTSAQLRAEVEARARDVRAWEVELSRHPGWLARAERHYGRHLDELRRVLHLPADAGELATLAFDAYVEDRTAVMAARQMAERYKAEIMTDRTLDRAWVGHRSAILPRELALARHALAQAEQAVGTAQARRAAALADLEETR